MRLKLWTMCCVLVACAVAAQGQMAMSGPKTAVGAVQSPAASLDSLLKIWEADVVPAAKAMPADKYDFAPSSATFASGSPAKFDTVRSFGQQVVHVAEANFYFYSTLSGMDATREMGALDAMSKGSHVDKTAAVKYLEDSIAFAHKAIATITTENAFVTIKGADGITTRAGLAAFGVAHGYDHYGQMVEYLRMNGIIPPSSAK